MADRSNRKGNSASRPNFQVGVTRQFRQRGCFVSRGLRLRGQNKFPGSARPHRTLQRNSYRSPNGVALRQPPLAQGAPPGIRRSIGLWPCMSCSWRPPLCSGDMECARHEPKLSLPRKFHNLQINIELMDVDGCVNRMVVVRKADKIFIQRNILTYRRIP
jgi:hypothetical protein